MKASKWEISSEYSIAPEGKAPKCLVRAMQIMILFVGNFIYSSKGNKHVVYITWISLGRSSHSISITLFAKSLHSGRIERLVNHH